MARSSNHLRGALLISPTVLAEGAETRLSPTSKGSDLQGPDIVLIEQKDKQVYEYRQNGKLMAIGVRRHRVAAAEATGIENGNRRSETTAYESLGSGLLHRVRAEGADAAGTGDCGGGGGR